MDLKNRARQVLSQIKLAQAKQSLEGAKAEEREIERTPERYMISMILDIVEASSLEKPICKVKINETTFPNQLDCYVMLSGNEGRYFSAHNCYGPYLYNSSFGNCCAGVDAEYKCPETAKAISKFEEVLFPQRILPKVCEEFKSMNISGYGISLNPARSQLEIVIL